jgi:uncharacterized membrane protein
VSSLALFGTAFLASAVEMVEALTIVLALGVVRGWRSPLVGAATAVVTLAVLVAALGPALRLLPIDLLRLVVGALLLVFGLQWMRKAILRAGGFKPMRDEQEAFQRRRAEAVEAGEIGHGRLDPYSFTLAFKGVLLEGLEVVLIVISFGNGQGRLPLVASAAAAAVIVVAAVGIVVRGPLARVPENGIKFGVGLMLTSFGIFWGVEGAGLSWPGGELALLVLLPLAAALSLSLVRRLRRVGVGQLALGGTR